MYDRRDPSRWPRGTLYPQKLALTPSTSGSRSVGIVLSRTQATEFNLFLLSELFHSKILYVSETTSIHQAAKVEGQTAGDDWHSLRCLD
jgi:hypothetical protein